MTFLYSYLAATVAQGVLTGVRVRLFAQLQRLPIGYFDRTPVGDVISRCTSDVETLDTVFSSGVAVLVANLVRLVTIAIGMVILSPPLTLVAGLVAPPLVLILRYLRVRGGQAERSTRIAVGALTARLQESLRGAEVIRAFGREREVVGGFRRVLASVLIASNRATRFSALYTPLTAILSALAVAALLWAGTRQAFDAFDISLGTLAAFLILLQRFFQPITALGEEWQTVQGALAGAERIFATLALTPESAVLAEVPTERRGGLPPIHLGDVVFGYAEGRPVLHRTSLVVSAGEHVALVGRTGAGKTSALQLLAGLYAPWAGTIRVASRDPRSLTESERRRVLGVVPQVVQLFDEATAAIDSVSDAAFRAALRESVLPGGCAVLTVAHRLSTAVEADRVIVLDKGYVVEEGTPGDLANRGGRFAALLELEAAGWDWRSGP